jgi:hypothetical protein
LLFDARCGGQLNEGTKYDNYYGDKCKDLTRNIIDTIESQKCDAGDGGTDHGFWGNVLNQPEMVLKKKDNAYSDLFNRLDYGCKSMGFNCAGYEKNNLCEVSPWGVARGPDPQPTTPAPTTPAPTTATTLSPKLDSGDVFYIINKNKFGGKYLFLSNCVNSEEYQLKCDVITDGSKENKTFNLPVGILSSTTDFEYENDISKYVAWNVSKINYNINIDGTLYVKDRLQVGTSIITADTIRKIKKLPYLFKDEICLKNSKGIISCMGPEHIEILRGERNLTIQTFIRLRPFTLYSKPNFKGRELKIGFDYKNSRNLPFIQFTTDGNRSVHPDGLWKSIKVEAPYSIILYDSPLEIETGSKLNSCESIEACNLKPMEKEICKTNCELDKVCHYVEHIDTKEPGKCELKNPPEIIANLYAHPNFNKKQDGTWRPGWMITIDRLGTYTKADLINTPHNGYKYKDNDISDIVIQTGYKITLYEHDNLKGRSQTFYQGHPKDGIGFLNDRMSSLKVEKDYTIKKKIG